MTTRSTPPRLVTRRLVVGTALALPLAVAIAINPPRSGRAQEVATPASPIVVEPAFLATVETRLGPVEFRLG